MFFRSLNGEIQMTSCSRGARSSNIFRDYLPSSFFLSVNFRLRQVVLGFFFIILYLTGK